MNRLTTGLLALALACSQAAAQDDAPEETLEPRRYTVEVIVFTYAENVSVGTEIFPPDEPAPSPDALLLDPSGTAPDGIEIGPDGEPVPVFTDAARPGVDDGQGTAGAEPLDEDGERLPIDPVLMLADDYSMQGVLDKLELLDAYEPLLHTGWTQSTLPFDESIALELPYFGAPPAGLGGSFTLYLGRYLHLVVDLTLDADAGTAAAYGEPILSYGDERPQYEFDDPYAQPAPGRVRYRIQEDRIVKNGDLRYFDHPKFGVIAKVTRVEEPDADPESGLEAGSTPLVATPVE